MPAVSLQKAYIDKRGGVVVLPLDEYERLRERSIPTYYLDGKEAMALDRSVAQALRDHRRGKTKKIRSLSDFA